MILLRKITLCVSLMLCSLGVWSQTTPPAAAPAAANNNRIPTDTLTGNFIKLHLEKKNYIINEAISITDSLIVDPGANIQLGNNVSLVCLGAVLMNGDETNRIKVTSRRGQIGTGMVIATQSQLPINIKYTNFDSLVMPLTFVDGWFRPQVFITNTQFMRNVGTTAVIQVLNPVVPVSDVAPVTNFRVTNSLFAGNIAPVRFEDLQSDFLKIEISNNVFIGNKIPGYGGAGNYTFSSNVLWGRMDKMQNLFKAVIRNNSFVSNFLSDINADTIVRQANIGIYGSGDSLTVPNNYWGTDNETEARKRIYDFSTNYNNPKFVLDPIAYAPADTLPPHVFDLSSPGRVPTPKRVFVNDKWVIIMDTAASVTYGYNLRQGMRIFKMTSNKPLLTRLMSVHFMYLRDGTGDSVKIADSTISLGSIKKESDKNDIKLTFSINTDSLFRSRPGYLVIRGLEGQKGEYIQDVTVGYESFLKYVFSKKPQNAYGRLGGGSDSNLQRVKGPPVITIPYKKKYEFGLVAGNAIYYGTLSNRNLFSNDYNSVFGVQFRYNHKKNFSVSLSYLSLTLTGSDLRSGDTAKVHRGMSFKTPVTTISFQFEYDFFDHSVYSSKYRLHPMIGFGLDNISFTPMGEYQGKFIPLQPLGTGGQNIPDTSSGTKRAGPYALSSLGAPVTFQLRYYLNAKTIFSAFATYHFAFTNYLDDVGPDPYPSQAALKANTPADLQEAAIYFSNPTNRYVRQGQLRSGVSDVSDGFFTFGFTLMHHF